MKEKIGQVDVEIVIFDAGGQPIEEPMTARERWTVEALNTTLLAHPPFGKQYPGAALERVEVMRGMDELGAGRYLRYRTSASPAPIEFWGGLAKGKKAAINIKTGQVTVPAGSQTLP
jgi:hypothetical protein